MESQDWFIKTLGFDRSVLRTCKKRKEFDVKGIHPRLILREIRRYIEQIKDENNNYILDIKKDPIQIVREDVGRSSGYVRGGLEARHEHYEHELGTVTFSPFKNLSKNLFIVTGIIIFAAVLSDTTSLIVSLPLLSLPFLYLGFIYRIVRANTTFPMKMSDDVYCLVEGEVNEDKSQKVNSNISLIISGLNYCSFWERNDYIDYLKDNFELTDDKIISKRLNPTLLKLGNFLCSKNYSYSILDEIEKTEREILIQIYEQNRDVIKKNSKQSILISNKNLKTMTPYQINQELQKYLESNFELGKYLNRIVLNQEIDYILKNKLNFKKVLEVETDIDEIINDLFMKFEENIEVKVL